MSTVIGAGVSAAVIQGMLATSQLAYRRFQRVGEEWSETCKLCGAVNYAAIEATESRAEALKNTYETMLTTVAPRLEMIEDVMGQIKSETEFLRSETTRLRQSVIERRANENIRAGYTRQASALLKQHAGVLTGDARDGLTRIVKGTLPATEIERAFRLAFDVSAGASPGHADAAPSMQQMKIISSLQGAEPLETTEKWLVGEKNTRLQRLEEYVAELELFYPERASAFANRIAALEGVTCPDSLTLDSLILDLRESVEIGRSVTKDADELRGIMEDIRVYDVAIGLLDTQLEFFNNAERALSASDGAMIVALTKEGRVILEDAARRLAAEQVRQEILISLEELGYAVEEASCAMWQENGRLVVRDRSVPQYGVEVGGDASKRLQFRLVGLTDEVDARRDYEMESAWCDKFEHLQEKLSERGTELLVEKRIQPGEAPLKRYTDSKNEQRAPSRTQTRHRQSQ